MHKMCKKHAQIDEMTSPNKSSESFSLFIHVDEIIF